MFDKIKNFFKKNKKNKKENFFVGKIGKVYTSPPDKQEGSYFKEGDTLIIKNKGLKVIRK